MFASYSMTPSFAYNSTPSMDCYHPTLPIQTWNNVDDNKDNNNNDGSSRFVVGEDDNAQNDNYDDVHHEHVSFSQHQMGRHDDTMTRGVQPTWCDRKLRGRQPKLTQQQWKGRPQRHTRRLTYGTSSHK